MSDLKRDGYGLYLDLHAFTMELAALQAEADRLGVPWAIRTVAEDMRTKFLPSLAHLRERHERTNG